MIEWSLDAFRGCDTVAAIVVAAPSGHEHDLGGVAGPDGNDLTVVDGGATRAQSVANALAAVGTELVAIHDAARPLLTAALVEGLVGHLAAAPEAAAVIAAAPIADTVKCASPRPGGTKTALTPHDGANALFVEETLDRSSLWAAQTPQVFRAEELRAALDVDAEARDAATDEAMLVEAAGGAVLIHPVAAENFKVTTPLDLRLAELLLADRGGTE